jgi:hypothetical protein
MLQAERIAEYLQSRLSQAAEIAVQNVFLIPGGVSRETWSFDARWHEGIGILEQLVICPRAPRGLTGLADGVSAN